MLVKAAADIPAALPFIPANPPFVASRHGRRRYGAIFRL
jgi:hypothetical protein